MGLDVGSRAVDVTVNGLLGWMTRSIKIIHINEEEENFGFGRLGELMKECEVTKFVVGLPKNMSNSIGPKAEASMVYDDKIRELFQLPVGYQNERLTTVQAERLLVEQTSASRAERKKAIDKLATVVVLQNYLDAHSR